MKYKEITKLVKIERTKKFKELNLEMAKAKASKTNLKLRQIRKIIARIKTLEAIESKKKKAGGKK